MHRIVLEPTAVGTITRIHLSSADKRVILWCKPAEMLRGSKEEGVVALPVTAAVLQKESGAGYLLKLLVK